YYEVLCKIYIIMLVTNVPLSAIIVAGIAIDRLCYAFWPFCHLTHAIIAKIFAIAAGIVAVLLGVLSALSVSTYHTREIPEIMATPSFAPFEDVPVVYPSPLTLNWNSTTTARSPRKFVTDEPVSVQDATVTPTVIHTGQCVQ